LSSATYRITGAVAVRGGSIVFFSTVHADMIPATCSDVNPSEPRPPLAAPAVMLPFL
jgi:hypothetical protein